MALVDKIALCTKKRVTFGWLQYVFRILYGAVRYLGMLILVLVEEHNSKMNALAISEVPAGDSSNLRKRTFDENHYKWCISCSLNTLTYDCRISCTLASIISI